jgi:hypothetical protein
VTTLAEVKQGAALARLQEQNSALQNSMEVLENAFADAMLALDDVGWRPLGGDEDATEIRLETIKTISQTTRGLVAINPLIKRGVAVRTTYIWGDGVKFEGLEESDPILTDRTNKKFMFSPQACAELEACMATDGQIFILITKRQGRRRVGGDGTPKITRVPMKEITGTISDPQNKEDIWFFRREFTVESENYNTREKNVKTVTAWYPADDYDMSNGKPFSIGGKPVVWNTAILHHTANKQVGWKWGAPDLMSVIFWTKAYKEFLENSATLVKAYSRFAFKVTAQNKTGVATAATKVAQQPTRDPFTGEVQGVGGTAVMGMGTTLSTIGRTGGSVDFSAGLPLAAMVAAGLEIPLTSLTADGGSSNRSAAETLETPTLKAMKARQHSWDGFFERMFNYLGKPDVKVVWSKIDPGDLLRSIQAITAAVPMNVLHAEEIREFIVTALELTSDKELPTEEELGLAFASNTEMGKAALKTAQNPPAPVAPGASKPNGSGNMPKAASSGNGKNKAQSNSPSYGDNSNRSAVGNNKYTKGNAK